MPTRCSRSSYDFFTRRRRHQMLLTNIAEAVDNTFIGGNVQLRAKLAARIPPTIVPAIQRDKFRRLVRYVDRRSPFYRRRFSEIGIDVRAVRGPEDMQDFFTTADDLRNN